METAVDLIEAAHHRFLDIFENYDHTESGTQRRYLASALLSELGNHMQMFDGMCLPKLEQSLKRPELIEEARRDSYAIKSLMQKMRELDRDSEHFDPTFRLIQESVLAHIELVDKLILPLVKQLGIDMRELARAILARNTQDRELANLSQNQELLAETAQPGLVTSNPVQSSASPNPVPAAEQNVE